MSAYFRQEYVKSIIKLADMDILEDMKKEMFRRKLSHKTMMTYLFYVKKFLESCKKEPKEFSKKDCREFLERFMKKDVCGSSLNVALNSLRFMMEEVLRRGMKLNIRYSKTPKTLPICLTKEEVKGIIDSIKNEKHRIIISLMYGAGLRVSEVVRLKCNDLDLLSNSGWVRHGKGDKDRHFILPSSLIKDIKILVENSKDYLFLGVTGTHLSTRSVQHIIKIASKKAGIKKNVHPHSLRHSFATHLLEKGNDVMAVQSLLGHSEARTTLNYIHTAKVKLINIESPLDDILKKDEKNAD